jgi:hypothetical protein
VAHPDSYILDTELLPGVNQPGGVALTTHPKQRVELYLYYPSGPSGHVDISLLSYDSVKSETPVS